MLAIPGRENPKCFDHEDPSEPETRNDPDPGHLQISVPAGATDDCYGTSAQCVRMLRPARDVSGTFETKIDGVNIDTSYQAYRIMIWQDSSNFIRFEYWSTGTNGQACAYLTIGATGSNAFCTGSLSMGSSNYLRVVRSGASFSLYYKIDSGTWTLAGTLTQAITLTQTGIYVDTGNPAFATTANFDYFTMPR